jgi:signal peptidase I
MERQGMIITVFLAALAVSVVAMLAWPRPAVTTMKGASMDPSIPEGEKVLIDGYYYDSNPIERGDIVAFRLKTVEEPLIKRVIALPGDRLEFIEGRIHVNGEEINEAYLSDPGYRLTEQDLSLIMIPLERYGNIVPTGSVFALNDNREVGGDSRKLGFMPISRIMGKVLLE